MGNIAENIQINYKFEILAAFIQSGSHLSNRTAEHVKIYIVIAYKKLAVYQAQFHSCTGVPGCQFS